MPGRQKQSNFWVFLAVVVVIVLIIVFVVPKGGPTPVPTPQPVVDTQVQQLQQQSQSDEVGAIEQDLQNTNLDQIDTELTEVDKTLQNL